MDVVLGRVALQDTEGQADESSIVDQREHAERAVVQLVGSEIPAEVDQRASRAFHSKWKAVGAAFGQKPALASFLLGVTTGLSSPSFPYFAVEPLVFLRHVEGPEGVPLAVQVGGS